MVNCTTKIIDCGSFKVVERSQNYLKSYCKTFGLSPTGDRAAFHLGDGLLGRPSTVTSPGTAPSPCPPSHSAAAPSVRLSSLTTSENQVCVSINVVFYAFVLSIDQSAYQTRLPIGFGLFNVIQSM